MRFEFTPRGRELSDKAFLADLRRTAASLGKQTLSVLDYKKYGKYPPGMFLRFGRWSEAVKKAGLKPGRLCHVSEEQLLTDIRRVAGELQISCLTQKQYVTAGKYSPYWVQHHYRKWHNAACAADLTSPARYEVKSTAELFNNLATVWQRLGRQPRTTDMMLPASAFTVSPYHRCFGSWRKALRAFVRKMGSAGCYGKQPATGVIPMHKSSRGISVTMRYRILHRDHFRCRICGRSPATDQSIQLQVDHIKPWSGGGETVLANLRTLCQMCNSGKSDGVA